MTLMWRNQVNIQFAAVCSLDRGVQRLSAAVFILRPSVLQLTTPW